MARCSIKFWIASHCSLIVRPLFSGSAISRNGLVSHQILKIEPRDSPLVLHLLPSVYTEIHLLKSVHTWRDPEIHLCCYTCCTLCIPRDSSLVLNLLPSLHTWRDPEIDLWCYTCCTLYIPARAQRFASGAIPAALYGGIHRFTSGATPAAICTYLEGPRYSPLVLHLLQSVHTWKGPEIHLWCYTCCPLYVPGRTQRFTSGATPFALSKYLEVPRDSPAAVCTYLEGARRFTFGVTPAALCIWMEGPRDSPLVLHLLSSVHTWKGQEIHLWCYTCCPLYMNGGTQRFTSGAPPAALCTYLEGPRDSPLVPYLLPSTEGIHRFTSGAIPAALCTYLEGPRDSPLVLHLLPSVHTWEDLTRPGIHHKIHLWCYTCCNVYIPRDSPLVL